MKTRFFAPFVFILSIVSAVPAQVPEKAKVIAGAERAFEKAAKTNPMPAPGCAIGVALNNESVFEKAFGLAEMEHNISNTPQTIFESGSVAKQFTAAGLILLQQDGKLSIDDPVRKYIPELPDYGSPLTIRHMLNHTAGLRDWGAVMALTGVGRGDRVVTQDIALEVMSRQKSLDFKPGAEYSYSNSGYNLAAIIVERVSKQKFGDFLNERIFKPLGMIHSSIRDDYQRIVPDRAQAYSREGEKAPWRLNMPIMNVYGNGGMLTTVGDWLKWNAMLDARTWNPSLVDSLETQGILNDGRKISYALGVEVGDYKGIKQVTHSGGTAGYQTYLARFPEKKISIAAMCNGFPPSSGDIVYSIVDEIFGPFPESKKTAEGIKLTEDQLKKYAGLWKNERSRNLNRIVFDKGELKLGGYALKPVSDSSFVFDETAKITFALDKDGNAAKAEMRTGQGAVTNFTAVQEWKPTDLSEFAGDWYSEEAQSRIRIDVENGKAYIVLKSIIKFEIKPVYKDAFSGQGYIMWFPRDSSGKVQELHVGGSRMRDMLFVRVK